METALSSGKQAAFVCAMAGARESKAFLSVLDTLLRAYMGGAILAIGAAIWVAQ
ncbi:MAG: hypothetical protein WAW85_04585 [Gordonia sp. (in: high G+C Gram-positive bacteria)]|uniref:hypothetical protein n=1 Tax=Gordonia sp. (in: high G+C Gram-positive bacteria) TaxID=84139 RepID=UPI003BB6176D